MTSTAFPGPRHRRRFCARLSALKAVSHRPSANLSTTSFSDERHLFPPRTTARTRIGPLRRRACAGNPGSRSMGCAVKYAYSEVGNFVSRWSSREIEFPPVGRPDAADQMVLALGEVAHPTAFTALSRSVRPVGIPHTRPSRTKSTSRPGRPRQTAPDHRLPVACSFPSPPSATRLTLPAPRAASGGPRRLLWVTVTLQPVQVPLMVNIDDWINELPAELIDELRNDLNGRAAQPCSAAVHLLLAEYKWHARPDRTWR